MAEKAKKKGNKNLIIGICAGVLVIAAIVVAIVFATRGAAPKLDDAYFKSDDTKYVLTVENDVSEDDEEYTPIKTHVVYNYSEDKITGMTTYGEYADEATAKAAYDYYKGQPESQEGVKDMSVNGKYLVIVMTEDNYADLTASSVKEQIEFMEMLNNMDLSDYEDEDEEPEVDLEEDEE